MSHPATNVTTLRLALGMRGGVSLAVWIGGAVAEVDHFRRASDGADFYSKLLDVGGYNAVEVDVMSGASAGGLNAVLAASAMLNGRSVSEMRSTWPAEAVAGRQRRTRCGADRGPPPIAARRPLLQTEDRGEDRGPRSAGPR